MDVNRYFVKGPNASGLTQVVTDWTGATGDGAVVADTHGLKVTTNAIRLDAHNEAMDLTISAVDVSSQVNLFGIWVYNNYADDAQLRFYLTDDGFTSFANANCIVSPGFKLLLVPNKTCWSLSGGFTWAAATAIDTIRVRLSHNEPPFVDGSGIEGGSGYVQVGKVAFGLKTRAIALLMQDDSLTTAVNNGAGFPTGYPSTGGNFKDIIESYGFRGTVSVIAGTTTYSGYTPTNRIDSSASFLTSAEVQTLAGSGHSIVNHASGNFNGPNATEGLNCLGPDAIGITGSAVNTGTDTITVASQHYFNTGAPLTFSGTDLPSPLATATQYYAILGGSETTFKVATSQANAEASTAVDLTTTGTPANWTVSHAMATADETRIQEVIQDTRDALDALLGRAGYVRDAFVLPGGGDGYYITRALQNLGMESARNVSSQFEVTEGAMHGGPGVRTTPTNVQYAFPPTLLGGRSYDSDSATAITAIGVAVDFGAPIAIWGHAINAARATNLDAICQELETRVAAGEIDVMTLAEYLEVIAPARAAAGGKGLSSSISISQQRQQRRYPRIVILGDERHIAYTPTDEALLVKAWRKQMQQLGR